MKIARYFRNRLIVTHDDPKQLKKAIKAWNDNAFFETFLPEPYYDETPEYVGDNWAWVGWRCANWGDYMDLKNEGILVDLDAKCLNVNFLDDWIIPVKGFEYLTEQGFRIEAMALCLCTMHTEYFSSEYGRGWISQENWDREWILANIPKTVIDAFELLELCDTFSKKREERRERRKRGVGLKRKHLA